MGFFIYTKIMYKCDDELWNRVRAVKKSERHTTLNETVTFLLKDALERYETNLEKSVYLKTNINDVDIQLKSQ